MVNGDQGAPAERVRRVVEHLPDARLVTLRDYAILGWTDLVAECTDEIGSAVLDFLAQHTPPGGAKTLPLVEEQGETVLRPHLERAFEGRRKPERDLHRVPGDVCREASRRIAAVRRLERSAKATGERLVHAGHSID